MADTLPSGVLELAEAMPATLRALLSDLPSGALEQRDPGGWSVRDVVAHLLSVEIPAFRERIALLVEKDEPFIPNVDEGEALANSGYAERPLAWLLDELERHRSSDVAWFRSLADLWRRGRHEVAGDVSIANVLSHLAYHDAAHLAQIAGILAAGMRSGRGNMNLLDPLPPER